MDRIERRSCLIWPENAFPGITLLLCLVRKAGRRYGRIKIPFLFRGYSLWLLILYFWISNLQIFKSFKFALTLYLYNVFFSFLSIFFYFICLKFASFFSVSSLFLSVKLCFLYCVSNSCKIYYDLLLFVLNLVNLDFVGKSSDFTVRVESIGDIFSTQSHSSFWIPSYRLYAGKRISEE